MRTVSQELPGLRISVSDLTVRAVVTGALGALARAALEAALGSRPGLAFEVDLERAVVEDAATLVALAERAERGGARVKLVAPSPDLYARLKGLAHASLAIELRAGVASHREDWGRFQVERVLASSRGRIAFAHDPRGARRVVLKVSASEPAGLLAAARAWSAKGPHPNLVTVLETDEERGLVVLEPVSGPSLDEVLLRGGPLEVSQALAIARGLAVGLARLSSAPGPSLVHGDVKPENVVLARDGSPVLVDFELLRERGSPGALDATTAYAAPERMAGAVASAAEDVFSWGVLVVELCGDPGPLAGLLARCRDADPAARPAWEELLAALPATAAPGNGALTCASCGRFTYRREAAPFACFLCGGPTRARALEARPPRGVSLAERLEAALRSGDVPAFEAARLEARSAEARTALGAAQALVRLGRPLEGAEVARTLRSAPPRLAADAALVEAEAGLDAGSPGEGLARLDALADELATSERRSALAACLRARAADEAGDLDQVLQHLSRARRTSEASDLRALAATVEGRARLKRGSLDLARAALEAVTEHARESDPGAALALAEARRVLAIVHARQGSWRRAAELAREAHDACAEGGSPLGVARALRTLAWVLLDEGRAGRAAEPLAVARALAQRLGASKELAVIAVLTAELACERRALSPPGHRDIPLALDAYATRMAARAAVLDACATTSGSGAVERAARACEALVGAWDAPRALVLHAEALAAANDPRAETAAADAERAALAGSLPLEAARAAAVLGRRSLARGENEAAARHLERAVDLAGTRPRAAVVAIHEQLARAYEASGRKSEAEEMRARATALRALAGL